MPWQKNFDVEEALQKAMEVFWRKGYEATTITDLTDATGVKRQSLYNAVGDKQQLFVRALLKYDSEQRRATLASLEARSEPLDSIRMLFTHVVKESLTDEARRGCLLVNTAVDLQAQTEEVQLLVTAALADFRRFFERMIEHGKVRSEISQSVDTQAAAAGLLGMFIGIRVLARGAFQPETLERMGEQALALVTESIPSQPSNSSRKKSKAKAKAK